MTRIRTAAAFLAALVFLFTALSPVFAEETDLQIEEILLGDPESSSDPTSEGEDKEVFTPSHGSPYQEGQGSAYWNTPMDITDEEAVWNMLMEPITVVNLGDKAAKNHSLRTKLNIFMYREPDKNSKVVGEVTNLSQGLRVIEDLGNGWTHVECYSSSFAAKPATKIKAWNILVNGYVESKYLKQVQPTDKIALLVDKLNQHLYVFQEGKMVAELLCSTGLIDQKDSKKLQPYNETRSGEFLVIHMTGELKSDNLICDFAMRFNAGDEIHEVPHQKDKRDGRKVFAQREKNLGTKRSHGCIRVQRLPDPDGINMEWIYKYIKKNNLVGKVKIVIWEDWQGRQIPVPDPDTLLYYNPNGGRYYHSQDHCKNGKGITFTAFPYSQLDEGSFAKLERCEYCTPYLREAEINAINAVYAPGEDHEADMNEARKEYYDYLAQD